MGGHAAGEVASQLVIAALAHLDDDEPGGDLLSKLDTAVRDGNSAIAAHVEADPELEGMTRPRPATSTRWESLATKRFRVSARSPATAR